MASGMPGPEDFDLDVLSRPARLIVSSQERRLLDPNGEFSEAGAIYQVPFTREATLPAQPLPIVERDGLPFHPHGIHLVVSGGITLLYVINHAMHASHSIEIFELRARDLRFLRRMRSPLLISPNDILALADGQFYVTNDHGETGIRQTLENLFAFGWSNVVHYRAGYWSVVADKIAFANGLALSDSGDTLYVAGTRDRGLFKYARNTLTGQLAYSSFINLNSGPDNLMWEKSGLLNVAAHPDVLAFVSHMRDKQKPSPADVFRVNVLDGTVTRIYSNDGTQISAASTALVTGGRLFVSQVFEPAVLSCSAPN
ncbi:MAG: SMP-30/gluconolactonase/LRE family protein [Spirochaetia bacterium]|nr:SMP-30/gluconolactonase/LRE family protein [Spirochaetia bacterium]